MNTLIWLLAQAPNQAPPAGGGGGGAPPAASPLSDLLIPMILVIGVFYFVMWRGNRKDRQKHQEMLNSVQRNDRVQTIGGIYGTVVETREDEIVVKVDETNNVKIRFHRSAIKDVQRPSEA